MFLLLMRGSFWAKVWPFSLSGIDRNLENIKHFPILLQVLLRMEEEVIRTCAVNKSFHFQSRESPGDGMAFFQLWGRME